MTYNNEFLFVLHKLCHIFPKQREWRIGHNDVCLFQKFDALAASEVAIFFKN